MTCEGRTSRTLFRAARIASAATVLGLAVGLAAAAAPALAAPHTISPFAKGHAYRHGVVPMRPGPHHHGSNIAASSPNDLSYGGGVSGVGVTTGAPRVYLVFWGSQWGTQSTNGQGNATFSGDPQAIAPVLQGFFKGLGTGGELWSGVMTQYCEGVASGSQTCPASSSHVGYPTGGALAGVWEDKSAAAPATASGHQIGAEAVAAAGHFGITTSAANRNVQYVIISPTGTNPDNYQTQGFCAWHDYTGDSTLSGGAVSSPYGPIAFTNLPYIPDAGAGCGQNFVNSGSAGTDDGVSIVEGHEYAETVTDQFPAGGWTDSSGNENGDKCAWISSGQGASQNISLTTGSFAVQSTWANDFSGGTGGCEVSHAIVSSGNTVTVTNPGNQSSTTGSSVSLQMQASDSASGQTLTYSATGLPAGLSINGSSGLISGTPTTAGTASVTVTATDTTGAAGTTSFTWTVSNPVGNTVTVTNPGNQSSTVGTAVSLQMHASDSASGQTLTYTATGLPAGLSIGSSSGLISGTPTTAGSGSVTVTATDTTGAAGSASFTWTVSSTAGNTVTVTNPGNQSSTTGTAVSLQIQASDSASGQTLTYSAKGLPAGLSINSSTGLISGTPTTAGTSSVTVNAGDTTGASGSASFTWTVTTAGGCTAQQLLGNPGFETGSAAPWTTTAGVIQPSSAGEPAHSGNWVAWLDGYGTTHTDTLAQTVTIPATCANATFSYWLHIDTAEYTTTTAYDTLKVQVLSSSGTVLATIGSFSNLNAANGYQQHSVSLAAYIGQKVTLKFTGSEDYTLQTSFVVDDTALNVS